MVEKTRSQFLLYKGLRGKRITRFGGLLRGLPLTKTDIEAKLSYTQTQNLPFFIPLFYEKQRDLDKHSPFVQKQEPFFRPKLFRQRKNALLSLINNYSIKKLYLYYIRK